MTLTFDISPTRSISTHSCQFRIADIIDERIAQVENAGARHDPEFDVALTKSQVEGLKRVVGELGLADEFENLGSGSTGKPVAEISIWRELSRHIRNME